MREISITSNDAGRRLDRFLRKYFKEASLGEIYKLIRKDIKVDGKRRSENYMLNEGETLTLYMSDEVIDKLTGEGKSSAKISGRNSKGVAKPKAKRQFRIIYEDDNILIADKPFGLLTHGDQHEKKNHLANQVRDYLIESGSYDPREKVFSPAPANRLDRNTTGLVLFGKTSPALKSLNEIIRTDRVDKYYLTIAHGTIEEEITLTGTLTKDEKLNKVTVRDAESGEGLNIVTVVTPVKVIKYDGQKKSADGGNSRNSGIRASGTVTLVMVKLVTGRSHQIRAHLASIGHPILGDSKYATKQARALNGILRESCGLATQLLHAYRLEFNKDIADDSELGYLAGKRFEAQIPQTFGKVTKALKQL